MNNICDEFLSKHHFAQAGALLIFLSCVFDIVPGLFSYALISDVIDADFIDILFMSALGMILTSAFVPYIWALQLSNSSNAVPVFQTIPVFVLILGWLFLGETITATQFFAAVLIIMASTLVGFDFEQKKINKKAVIWMLFSSFVIAIYSVASKIYIVEYNWITFAMWNWLGSGLLCLSLVLLIKNWRQKSVQILKSSPLPILSIFLLQVVFQVTAVTIWFKAVSIGPSVALVQTLNGLQPAFVLIYSMIAGYVFAHYFPKVNFDRALLFKFTMLSVIVLGIYLLTL